MTLKVTYIGHATCLIQGDGLTILTDPVFSNRILCFKRKIPLPYNPAHLPRLDAILISHAHYDHLDLFSFKYIPSSVPIFVPEGMSKAIAPFFKNPVIELSTWSRFQLKEGTDIIAVPAKHPGGRFLIPYRYRTCHGYVISCKKEQIYFAGDTTYSEHFSKIRSLFSLQLALLPLTKRSRGRFGENRHLDPQKFLMAWEDLGKPDCIPIHWGSFFRRRDIQEVRAELGHPEKIHVIEPGEPFSIPPE